MAKSLVEVIPWTVGDTQFPLDALLLDGDQQPLDLTDCEVFLLMIDSETKEVKIDMAPAVILNVAGQVQYEFTDDDVDEEGRFSYWWISKKDGKYATLPPDGETRQIEFAPSYRPAA